MQVKTNHKIDGRKQMKLQQVLSLTRKAVDEYKMIEKGDKIVTCISGGKDSLTLLYALAHYAFYPNFLNYMP